MTYWHNSVVYSTNLYFSPGIFFPQLLQISFSETLYHSDGSEKHLLFSLPSLLASIILRQHPRLPTLQNRLFQASIISCSILPHNSAAGCQAILTTRMESTSSSTRTFSPLMLNIFLKPQLSLYPAYPSLNLQLILSGLYCHVSFFLYQIESAKPYSIKIVHLIFFYLCLIGNVPKNYSL